MWKKCGGGRTRVRCVEEVWWRENKGEMCGRSVVEGEQG